VLDDAGDALHCPACERIFEITDGVPDLVGATDAVNRNEVSTQDRVSDFYEAARYRRPWARTFHRQNLLQMIDMVGLEGRILDNGCGTGILLDAARDRIPPAAQVIGLDISRGMLAKARHHHNRLVRGDATRLPFADAVFDTVFARSLLHHLPDREAGVREIARVLKPGGGLVVLDTHKTIISTVPRLIANHGDHFDGDHGNFRTRELTGLLGRHLRVEAVEYMGYVAYPLLAFPDLIDFGRWLPLNRLSPALLAVDRALSKVPGVRCLGWGVIVKARRT
jgi:ubiquinone/menaquinone biosynthesis C-methylase UbiE